MKKEHEKRVCKAVLGVIARRKNIVVEGIDYPDEKEHGEQAVDMLVKCSSGEMVVEHTRIESYPEQIEDWSQVRKLLEPLREGLEGKLPAPGHYELAVDIGACKGAKDTKEIQKALVKWIERKAPSLRVGSPEVAPEHCIKERPDGVPFEVTLCRWPGNDGKFYLAENAPDDLQERRRERISKALEDKCPKLCKARGDARRSALVLELDDISLGSHISVGQALVEELNSRNDVPDEIYLVRSELDEWVVWVLKDGEDLFRGVAKPGPYYLDAVC